VGTWGTAIFSDDLACDVRAAFRQVVLKGLEAQEATDEVIRQFSDTIDDPDEGPVFWLALAATSSKMGRLVPHVRDQALEVIKRQLGIDRYEDAGLRTKRLAVLEALAEKLTTEQPAPIKVRQPKVIDSGWAVGDIIAFNFADDQWTLLHVRSIFLQDYLRFPVCEVLDWVGDKLPPPSSAANTGALKSLPDDLSTRADWIALIPTRDKATMARYVRTGLTRRPASWLSRRINETFRPETKSGQGSYVSMTYFHLHLPRLFGVGNSRL
jgi:hypothetical protein